jgi:ATP/maltotriose-dependent transcriptional regulator MalT
VNTDPRGGDRPVARRGSRSQQEGAPGAEARPWASVEACSASLTTREWEVLSVLVTGASNREISARLHISPRTVANHLARIYDKLGTRTRTRAVARAVCVGPGPL